MYLYAKVTCHQYYNKQLNFILNDYYLLDRNSASNFVSSHCEGGNLIKEKLSNNQSLVTTLVIIIISNNKVISNSKVINNSKVILFNNNKVINSNSSNVIGIIWPTTTHINR